MLNSFISNQFIGIRVDNYCDFNTLELLVRALNNVEVLENELIDAKKAVKQLGGESNPERDRNAILSEAQVTLLILPLRCYARILFYWNALSLSFYKS